MKPSSPTAFRIIPLLSSNHTHTYDDMPIYEYQCEKCHHTLEALQKFSDKPLRECPECGKHSLKRLISAPMFRLAGSGWYETDFKSENERKRNLAGKDEAPPAESGSTDKPAKSEPTAEKKPEAKEPARKSVAITKPPVKAAKASTKRPVAKKGVKKKTTSRR
jgi:putative FmdB family regulatory protein